MSKKEDLELDQLLARGRLAGPQYDEIEQRILAQVAPARARSWWPALGGALALASGLGAWLLVANGLPSSAERGGAGELRSRGSETVGAVLASVRCASVTGECRQGDTLMFSLQSLTRPGHVVAYAERLSAGPGQPRIWYFPTPGHAAPRLEAGAGTVVLREGVRLGPPHTIGQYQVTLWLSDAPTEAAAPAPPAGVEPTRLTFEIVE